MYFVILICMHVLPACMSVHCVCAWCPWRLEDLDSLKLGLRTVRSQRVRAGSQPGSSGRTASVLMAAPAL